MMSECLGKKAICTFMIGTVIRFAVMLGSSKGCYEIAIFFTILLPLDTEKPSGIIM